MSGLTGGTLVLEVNGISEVSVKANGQVTLASLASGSWFTIAVKTQPSSPPHTCTVDKPTGVVRQADVADISVICVRTYAIGGNLSGLQGSTGLLLRSSLGDELALTTNGPFVFPTRAVTGMPYTVTVGRQPASPLQTCSVARGLGAIAKADVLDLSVVCSTDAFKVGGTVNGLAEGSSLVLTNNGSDDLTVGNNGSYWFNQLVADGAEYSVTVKAHPTHPWQECLLSPQREIGEVDGTNVDTVEVTCTTKRFPVAGSINGLARTGLVLTTNGQEWRSSTGQEEAFVFPTAIPSGTSYEVRIAQQPTSDPRQVCFVNNGTGSVGGVGVSDVTVECDLAWIVAAAGSEASAAIKSDGSLWRWGDCVSATCPPPVMTGNDWSSVSIGALYALGIRTDGTLQRPSVSAALANGKWLVVSESLNGEHELAIRADRTLWVSGFGDSPELGLGGVPPTMPLTQVGTDSDCMSVSAGMDYTLAVKTDGTLWGWGKWASIDSASPQQLGPEADWESVSSGTFHALAKRKDGSLWAVGENEWGQLGDGTTDDRQRFVQVGAMRRWASVSAGAGFTLALGEDGSLWAWGTNSVGRLGVGSPREEGVSLPIQVGAATDWDSVSAGEGQALAIKKDGSLWAWGSNYNGEVGDGTTTDRLSPVRIR